MTETDDVVDENVGGAEDVVEGAGETVVEVEDAGEVVEGVEDAGEVVEGVEDAGDVVEGVADAGEVVESVEDAGDVVEGVADVGEVVEGVEDAGDVVEDVADAGDVVESVEDTEEVAGEVLDPTTPDSIFTSSDPPVKEDSTSLIKGDCEQDAGPIPEMTVALIKPDGLQHVEKIQDKIRDEGFSIVQKRRLRLSPEQASDLYYEHYGQPYFPSLVATMCTGPVEVYVLGRQDAVDMWRHLCGPCDVEEAKRDWPDSIRALYGTPGEAFQNVCHGSSTKEKALEEIRFFFPKMILDENMRNVEGAEDYLKESVNPTLSEGLINLCKSKPEDPVTWLADWLLTNNPNRPILQDPAALSPV